MLGHALMACRLPATRRRPSLVQRAAAALRPQIASLELREKKIPFTIRRYLPDGRCGPTAAVACCAWRACLWRLASPLLQRAGCGSPRGWPGAGLEPPRGLLRAPGRPTTPPPPLRRSYEDWSVEELILMDK
jgi:hypothetical protein